MPQSATRTQQVAWLIAFALSVLQHTVQSAHSMEPPLFETTFLGYEAGSGSGRIAIADIDGNGTLDIVAVDFPTSQFNVLLSVGDGSFAAPIHYPLPSTAKDIAVGDLNGDSLPDLAMTMSTVPAISIWIGTGGGMFQLLSNSVPAASGCFGLCLADVNGDSILDLAVANETPKTLSVAFGIGDGTFAPESSYTCRTGTRDVAIADLNGDTFPDVAVAAGSAVSVYLNDGTGHFGPKQDFGAGQPLEILLIDISADGKRDIVVANAALGSTGIGVRLGNGNGTFAPFANYPTPANLNSATAGDVNRDGKVDAVGVSGNGLFTVWKGVGNGTFTNRGDYLIGAGANSVVLGDLDGDLWPDVIASADDPISVSRNRGNGTFGPNLTYPTPNTPFSVAVGDLNGDSFQDIAVGRLGSPASVLLGNGDGTFDPYATVSTGNNPLMVVLKDFNRDNKLDMATSNNGSNSISVLMGNGDGSFATRTDYAAGSAPGYIVSGNFNADDYWDLAVTNELSSTLGIYLGNGDGTFQPQTTLATGYRPVALAIADLNHDSVMDLVAVNENGQYAMWVYLGTGTGSFELIGTNSALSAQGIDLGDVDGDGELDAITTTGGSTNCLLMGHGDGSFTFSSYISAGPSNSTVRLRDMDGDGNLDIALSNYTSYVITFLRGLGSGVFLAPVFYGVGDGSQIIAVADVNQDNKLDVLSPSRNAANVAVLLNIGPYTSAVPELIEVAPRATSLAPAWPNPFVQAVHLSYEIPETSPVQLRIFDVAGRPVRTLVDGLLQIGQTELTWNGLDDRGRKVGPGVYLVRLDSGTGVVSQKIVRGR